MQIRSLLIVVALAAISCANPAFCAPASQPASMPTTQPVKTDPEIAAFEAADQAHPPAPGSTVFYGSSTIRFWSSLAADFPDRVAINRGFGGSQIVDCVRYVDPAVLRIKPKTIVIYAGDNDLAVGRSPADIADDFIMLSREARDALPHVRIAFISIKPSPSRWKLKPKMDEANARVRMFIEQSDPKHMCYIDIVPVMLGPDGQPRAELFRPDMLHMKPEGYALWTPIVQQALKALER